MKRAIRLLHIEDDQVLQRMIAHHLDQTEEYRFAIDYAVSEEEAIRMFESGGVEAVLLDYHLKGGNGLNCLRRMRAADPLVPIIAISGTASAEIAAELIEAGADDFLNKLDLDFARLSASLLPALKRSEAMRGRMKSDATQAELKERIRKVTTTYLQRFDEGLLADLNDLETLITRDRMSPAHVEALIESHVPAGNENALARLRPLLLELAVRMNG